MSLFPSDMEFLVNMNAMLGLRTELVGGPVQFFRQTSDGLMSVFNFFHMLSTSKCLISVEEVQSCIFQLHLFICCSLMCGISKHESHCHLFELEPCFVCYNNASQKEILVMNNTHKALAKMCGQYILMH